MEKNTPKDAGRRRIGRIVVIAVIALAAASIAWWLLVYGRDVLALLTDGRRVQEQAARLGPLAPVALAGLVAVQQLSAVLPAAPRELAVALFLSRKRLDDLERFAASPRFELILFVYFLVPGLPKDLMTYAAALARVKPLRILLITSVGRVPSIAASVLASSLAADGDWRAAGVVLAGIVVLVLAGAAVYARVRMRHRSRSQSP